MEESAFRKGRRAAVIGLVCNLLLAAAKIAAGCFCMLVSVVADGINNLSDCGSGAVALVSMHVSRKPPDKEHPYGHRRMEYIASLIVGFLILVVAVELIRDSAERIFGGAAAFGAIWVYFLLALSVAVKGLMFVFYRVTAVKIRSDVLKAAAKDSLCDCFATAAVMLGLLFSELFSVSLDGYFGIAVALFVAWEGIGIVKEESSKLIGQAPDPVLMENIKKTLSAGEGVLGFHDLRIYGYGDGKAFATVHIEADASVPALISHERVDKLEHAVQENYGVELTAHLDPVDLSDEEARELELRVRAAAESVAEVSVHDFRIVRCAKTKVIFEAAVPFSCLEKDEEILKELECAVRLLGDYQPVISVERQ